MIYLPGEFPLDPDLCYLNHAAIGPWPKRTAHVVANLAQTIMQRGGSDYPQWLKVAQRLRERLARLINAPSPTDIALVKNTSEALSIVSQGLPWQTGDEVVGVAGDFCSNEMVWEVLGARGVRYSRVNVSQESDPEGALIGALSPATRLLAVSSVHFATGYRYDLKRLSDACRAQDILLSVDAIQSLGAVPFDLNRVPADFVMAGGHKWLLSPEGIGFFYCRADLRERLALHQFGWGMRADPYAFEREDWEPAESARRFEAGTPNMLGIHGLDASLSLFDEVGMDTVEQRLSENIAFLETGLRAIPDVEVVTPGDPERRAGILTFRHAKVFGKVMHGELLGQQVICSSRSGGVRLAPHFYTPKTVLKDSLAKIRQTIQLLK